MYIPEEVIYEGKTYTVKAVGATAFQNCESLREVVLSDSITAIGDSAFAGCSAITTVESLNPTAPILNETAFDTGVYAVANLFVPEGSLDSYQESDGWKLFANIKENISSGIDDCTGAELKVVADGGRICVEGAAPDLPVEIYSLGGQLVYRGVASDFEFSGTGFYLVKVADQTVKVVL